MTNNKQQTAVEWLVCQLQQTRDWQRVINEANQSTTSVRNVLEQAKEMEKEQIAEAESENSEAFADGYSKGYDRALELVKWALSNLIPPYNEKQ
jgi:flagellar biosynthesis/type III secretory pathway protein FliH